MTRFRRKKKKIRNTEVLDKPVDEKLLVQTRNTQMPDVCSMFGYQLTDEAAVQLYRSMRETIPLIDAALAKIERLIGGFCFTCEDKQAEEYLNIFSKNVKVGASSIGLEHFICSYLDSLLLYGNAVGEIVLDEQNEIVGLYNADISDVLILPGENPLSVKVCSKNTGGTPIPPVRPELLMFTALNPPQGKVRGNSVLSSLSFVSDVLLKIYNAVGMNFERLGNVRFAVTYKPGESSSDQAYAKERAQQIAKEWSEGMRASKNGDIRDFVAVGDVNVKVIGADNQIIDCDAPAKQMLEQILSKLSIPPFMLGLSWSTTERMSQQQADALTGDLAYYRRLLDPIITKIATCYLRTKGYSEIPTINWDILSFNDEIQMAKTRLYNAQAQRLELENSTDEENEAAAADLS